MKKISIKYKTCKTIHLSNLHLTRQILTEILFCLNEIPFRRDYKSCRIGVVVRRCDGISSVILVLQFWDFVHCLLISFWFWSIFFKIWKQVFFRSTLPLMRAVTINFVETPISRFFPSKCPCPTTLVLLTRATLIWGVLSLQSASLTKQHSATRTRVRVNNCCRLPCPAYWTSPYVG